jgi:hypothetical protein
MPESALLILKKLFKACIKLSQCILCITGIPNGDSKSETENGTLVKAMKMEESCEAQSNRPGDEKTEIRLESDGTFTIAYSVVFKEEHGEVKEQITEKGGIDHQNNDGEDQTINIGEDLSVVEMKDKEDEDDIFQVKIQF